MYQYTILGYDKHDNLIEVKYMYSVRKLEQSDLSYLYNRMFDKDIRICSVNHTYWCEEDLQAAL